MYILWSHRDTQYTYLSADRHKFANFSPLCIAGYNLSLLFSRGVYQLLYKHWEGGEVTRSFIDTDLQLGTGYKWTSQLAERDRERQREGVEVVGLKLQRHKYTTGKLKGHVWLSYERKRHFTTTHTCMVIVFTLNLGPKQFPHLYNVANQYSRPWVYPQWTVIITYINKLQT